MQVRDRLSRAIGLSLVLVVAAPLGAIVLAADLGVAADAMPPGTPVGSLSPLPAVPPVEEKHRGISVPVWGVDAYDDPSYDRAVVGIEDLGADWITIIPTWYQDETTSTVLTRDEYKTASDNGVRRAATLARDAGIQVALKPHVDVRSGAWRGDIEPSDVEAWFESYRQMITAYASLATEIDADLFVVGTELERLGPLTDHWLAIVAEVEARYDGPLTYVANWGGEEAVKFWGALDYIGSDAYYPLATTPTRDVAQLVAAWQPIKARLRELVATYRKPLLFTEAGYQSQTGSTVSPWFAGGPPQPDEAEQAAAYEALLRAFWGTPWFAGVHWWAWDDPSVEGYATGFGPNGKQAELVLRQWWNA